MADSFFAGSQHTILSISFHNLIFLLLSGGATGASSLCFFKALQLGGVNKVTPVDKSSTILTIILAFLFLREVLTVFKGIGLVVLGTGTYLMVQRQGAEPTEIKIIPGFFIRSYRQSSLRRHRYSEKSGYRESNQI